jgi:hypothetical protein
MRFWQQDGVKLAKQCNPSSKGVSGTREGKAYLQVQMRKGTRLDGMVNLSELSINFVTRKKPNALTGFDQKRYVAG